MDNTDILDVVLKQVEANSRSKVLVRSIIDKVKIDMSKSINNEFELTPAELLNIIESIRNELGGNYSRDNRYDLLDKLLKCQFVYYRSNKNINNELDDTYYYLYTNSINVYE
jgi:hypothetical protein